MVADLEVQCNDRLPPSHQDTILRDLRAEALFDGPA